MIKKKPLAIQFVLSRPIALLATLNAFFIPGTAHSDDHFRGLTHEASCYEAFFAWESFGLPPDARGVHFSRVRDPYLITMMGFLSGIWRHHASTVFYSPQGYYLAVRETCEISGGQLTFANSAWDALETEKSRREKR